MGYLASLLAVGLVVVILAGLASLGGCASDVRMVCKVSGAGSCEVDGGRRSTVTGVP